MIGIVVLLETFYFNSQPDFSEIRHTSISSPNQKQQTQDEIIHEPYASINQKTGNTNTYNPTKSTPKIAAVVSRKEPPFKGLGSQKELTLKKQT